jgi:hypothetical protein
MTDTEASEFFGTLSKAQQLIVLEAAMYSIIKEVQTNEVFPVPLSDRMLEGIYNKLEAFLNPSRNKRE